MKKKISIILVVLLCMTFSIVKTNAKSYAKELFQTGEKLTVDENLEGTAFLAGEKVNVNSKINGIGFIAANELNINEKQEYIFGFGTKANIKNVIEKDLFLFASTVNLKSNVLRDAYIGGEEINIDGKIDRNLYIYGTEVNLNGEINGDINLYATKVNISEEAKINGTIKYNEDIIINGLNENINTKTYETNTTITFKDYITNFISSYIHITVFAIVLIFISEKLLTKSLKQTKNIDGKKFSILCGKGFLILLGVPIILLMLLFTGLFVSVGIIGALVYGILVYIAEIFTAYFIADLIDKKYLKKNINIYTLVIIGLFIIKVLSIVPLIGGIISFLSLLLGLGILGNMIIEQK